MLENLFILAVVVAAIIIVLYLAWLLIIAGAFILGGIVGAAFGLIIYRYLKK